ncbi:type IV pilus modification PilV family protein [Methylosoma difficile]
MKANKQQGFSLLEILIAFSIMALSLGILLRIFSGGVNTAIVAEDYSAAMQIAESLLDRVGVETDLAAQRSEGTEADKYRWQVTVEPFDFNPNGNPLTLSTVQLFKISVAVEWGEDEQNPRRLDLQTLRLASQPAFGKVQ